MKVLLTGFNPFGTDTVNPAEEAVKRVKDQVLGADVIKVIVPTTRFESLTVLEEAVATHQPDVVICVGQAGGRFDITPERVAINMDDYRIQDNEGNQPIDEVIYEDGETAYFSNLPIKAMVQRMKEQEISASVSNSAGTFVCNHIMYGALYLVDKKYPNMKAGFIHIPYMRNQVVDKPNMPAMELETIVKGLEAAIEACVLNDQDIKAEGGTIC